MKRTFRYALLLAGATSLPALAHVTYTGRNFGTFDNTHTSSTLMDQAVPGNFGWIDGTDSDYGDSHKLRAYPGYCIQEYEMRSAEPCKPA
jgi:hypothetical protein